MALDSCVNKLRTVVSGGVDAVKPRRRPIIGVLAFEISGHVTKLLHLWKSLSPALIARLRNEAIAMEGVRKLVSDDDAFLLAIACAEMAETLRLTAASVSRLCGRCDDPNLRLFDRLFRDFADSGWDPCGWTLPRKEMEALVQKMAKYASATSKLRREMEELAVMEQGLKRLQECKKKAGSKTEELRQRLMFKREEVKHLKERSLWGLGVDAAALLLVRSSFTVLARIKLVFGIRPLPRDISASPAAVHPCVLISHPNLITCNQEKEEELREVEEDDDRNPNSSCGLLHCLTQQLLHPPPWTLGAAAMAVHYAALVIAIEKMVRSPRLVDAAARDELYSMLPARVKVLLRRRLRVVGRSAATDPALAGEWRAALRKILEWLSPLAHNMIRWQCERSYELHRRGASEMAGGAGVLLLQTLYFADMEKTEETIAELLVGLNYVWRFEIRNIHICKQAVLENSYTCLQKSPNQ